MEQTVLVTGEGETVRYPFRVTHGFRKFFETKAYQAGMSRTDVYFLVDHQLGIDSSYVRPTEQELIRSYFKIIDCLTINGTSLENSEILRNQQELAIKMLERDNTIQALQQDLRSLQEGLRDMKMLELRRLKDLVYGRKKFQQEVVKEMELGKDFGTVLSQKLDPDVMMSHIKNDKKIPRIYREVVMKDLIDLKEEVSKGIQSSPM